MCKTNELTSGNPGEVHVFLMMKATKMIEGGLDSSTLTHLVIGTTDAGKKLHECGCWTTVVPMFLEGFRSCLVPFGQKMIR